MPKQQIIAVLRDLELAAIAAAERLERTRTRNANVISAIRRHRRQAAALAAAANILAG